jgi:rubredoxin
VKELVKRYYESDVKTETKTVEIFECPDCGFEFNAMHEVDEQVGGWECPLCEVDELQKVINIEVKKEILSYHVCINGICVTTFKEKWKAEEFVGGLKNLNPYHRIKRIF